MIDNATRLTSNTAGETRARTRQFVAWTSIAALLLLAFVFDVMSSPGYHVPSVYFGVPILIAAYSWSPRKTALVSVAAVVVYVAGSLVVGVNPMQVEAGAVAVGILGFVGTRFSGLRERERQSQLELKRSARALALEQARLRAALDASRVSLTNQDLDLKYTWVGTSNWLDESEVLGKTDAEIVPPDDAERLAALKQSVLQTGIGVRQEVEVTLSGQQRSIDLSVQPLRDELGRVTGITVGAVDVSVTKRLLESERVALHEAETARRRLEQFVAAAVHEIGQPLTTVSGLVQMLQRAPTVRSERERNHLLMIDDAVNRMNRLLEDLRDVGSLDGGEFRIRTVPASLNRIIDAVSDAARADSPGRAIDIEVPEELSGFWDPVRVSQLLSNLISNAAKYSPAGTRIRIRAVRDGGSARCTVSDEGPGIPADQRELVFEPFYRLDATRHVTGTGLGLFICKRIVDAHGGRIWVEQPNGSGTSMTFVLPGLSETGPAVDSTQTLLPT